MIRSRRNNISQDVSLNIDKAILTLTEGSEMATSTLIAVSTQR